ncbi:hypothetical protein N7457_001542 [Penicillium paradoxum]|uniref:uncharacterized protein n=1 Tax=Penicillium paradoxum TaxID=176176 RepID=UPI00254898BF|nr:uncharacterized protein N7457_001542 [Penicillium paradoxum]KAJ5794943.1 hypothetical protein N7457_001542 [Penicillium paradoxum]
MSFVAIKLLKLGYGQAKKHKAKKDLQKYQDAGVYPPNHPEEHPMSGYPAGAAPGTTIHYDSPEQSKGSKLAFMFFSLLRFLQFVFGLTVIGLYGKDVHHDHSEKHTWHSKWVYALVTAFLATITAAIHIILPFVMRKAKANGVTSNPALLLPQFVWEFVVTVLWLALFGVFGKMYIGVHADTNTEKGHVSTTAALGDESKINRMRHAVWIDIINLVFWVMTSSWVLMRWLKSRKLVAPGFDAEKGNVI